MGTKSSKVRSHSSHTAGHRPPRWLRSSDNSTRTPRFSSFEQDRSTATTFATAYSTAMKPATVFALHFARLVSELVKQPGNHSVHRATVDELLTGAPDSVVLTWDNWQLVTEDELLPASLPGVQETASRMAAHGIRAIAFSHGAEPGHVLGTAWILAREPAVGDGGASAMGRLGKLGTQSIRMIPVVDQPAALRARPDVSRVVPPTPPVPVMTYDFDLYEPPPRPHEKQVTRVVSDVRRASSGMFQHYAASKVSETPEEVIGQLAAARNMDQLSQTLESLSLLIESAYNAERYNEAARLFYEVVHAEADAKDPAVRRAHSMMLHRMAKPEMFRRFAAIMAAARDRH